MARTVEKILKEDEDKLDIGVEEEALEQEPENGSDAPTPEETAEDLRKQLAAANARAEREATGRREAEATAAKATNTAGSARQAQIATQKQAIEGKISEAQTKLDASKQQLKQAKTAGDSDAEVDLQDAVADARYALNAAKWEKDQFDRWEEAQLKQPAAATERASPYTDKEQAWIDSHPEFGTSKKFARTAKLAAQEAIDEGHKQDSVGYFKYIEDTLQEGGFLVEAAEPLSGAGNTTTSVAAAPNRTGTGSPAPVGKNAKYPHIPNGFRIPSDWVEAAQLQGFDDPREYANDRLEIEAKEKGQGR